MRKRLFFALVFVAALSLLSMGIEAWQLTRLGYEIDHLPARLDPQGWHIAWQGRETIWRPWGSRIVVVRPLLTGPNDRFWAGSQITLGTDLLHPFSLSLSARGTQIIHWGPRFTLGTGTLNGRLVPKSGQITLRTDTLTVAGAPLPGVEMISFQNVTAHILMPLSEDRQATALGVDLRAETAMPQFTIDKTPANRLRTLLSLLPPPRNLRLIVAVPGIQPLMAESSSFSGLTGNGRYLIQEASFLLGPLSCVARGTLDHEGTGTLWAHITGMREFARFGVDHAPVWLRANPDYAPLFRTLDEQTVRIPDRIDLPLQVGSNDNLLQNHILAIITGHSR